MTHSWNDIFEPVAEAYNLSVRPPQAEFGNAVIKAFVSKQPLIGECGTGTGKSFGALVPMITCILDGKRNKNPLRGVISTETNSLLDQYLWKDLPSLSKVYPGFSYAALKGRAHYTCFNHIKMNSRGDRALGKLGNRLQSNYHSLGNGEREDIERFLGYDLTDQEWYRMRGSANGCSDFKCEPEECFSARARAIAAQSDLVVTNHSILRVDADMRSDGQDGFLGPVDYLVVDEAHTLEDVLISGWTDVYTEWEINEIATKLFAGVSAGRSAVSYPNIDKTASDTVDLIRDYITDMIRFYRRVLPANTDWSQYEELVKQAIVNTSGDPELRAAMEQHEVVGSAALDTALANLTTLADFYKEVIKTADTELSKKQMRDVLRSRSAAAKLADLCSVMRAAMDTRDGIVSNDGVPTVVMVSGIVKQDGTETARVSLVPLEVAKRASGIWRDRKCVLMSATLQDISSGGFRYLKASLGIGDASELIVDAPFKYADVQRTYITNASGERADVPGAWFSVDELRLLIEAAHGRTLVLFTANRELTYAYEQLSGTGLPYRLLVQDGNMTKRQLTDAFREDTDSVLLATKSFFTGNDFQGETLSQVILAKYPQTQWNAINRARTSWWRSRGFPRWYNEQSMNVFRQAAGRLIRSDDCRGVISLLDHRAADPASRVYSTAMESIHALGSPIINTVTDVEEFLDRDISN